jgi:hypothetical protein
MLLSECDCEFDDRNSKETCEHCLQHSCQHVDRSSAYTEDYDGREVHCFFLNMSNRKFLFYKKAPKAK